MRAPTLMEIIAASIAVSIVVLAVKRSAPPPATLSLSPAPIAGTPTVAARPEPVSVDPVAKLAPWVEIDYPNPLLKPADAAYPPFADPFPAEQHRVGPWPPIQEWLKDKAGSQRNRGSDHFP